MKKIQDDNVRIEILRYNDAYICSFACYGVTHTTGPGREVTRRKWTQIITRFNQNISACNL